MFAHSTLAPGHRKTCTQPHCPFKAKGFKADDLPEEGRKFLDGALNGEMHSAAYGISFRPVCRLCAQNVMMGKKAFHTASEWKHLDDMGSWHARRHRRSNHWGYRHC